MSSTPTLVVAVATGVPDRLMDALDDLLMEALRLRDLGRSDDGVRRAIL